MRYYELWEPGASEPHIRTNVRDLRGLLPGTRIYATYTDTSGSVVQQTEISVVDGRPKVERRGKHRPQFT